MRPVSGEELLQYVAGLGYAVFESGLYNLNIIGVRTPDDNANTFKVRLYVVYRDEWGWLTRSWDITTDPGMYWRENPGYVDGTAILVPGQYRGAYKLGKHRGKYPALVQTGAAVRVWRDNNRDQILDQGKAQDGYFGINIHRASKQGSETVDKWSAGCQVFGDPDDYECFMDIVERATEIWGSRFTYTLVDGGAH